MRSALYAAKAAAAGALFLRTVRCTACDDVRRWTMTLRQALDRNEMSVYSAHVRTAGEESRGCEGWFAGSTEHVGPSAPQIHSRARMVMIERLALLLAPAVEGSQHWLSTDRIEVNLSPISSTIRQSSRLSLRHYPISNSAPNGSNSKSPRACFLPTMMPPTKPSLI